MAKYRVRLITSAEYCIDVEADSEDAALDEAYQEAPGLCPQCGGWGKKWGLDLGEWQSIEEFLGEKYDPEMDGSSVELVEE